MSSVGVHLRGLRERRGISLEEISRGTRIPTRFLEALEAERFEALPAPVFTRGFIRAYCQALGDSGEEALALFDGQRGPLSGGPVRDAAPTPRGPRAPRGRGAVLVSFVLLVVLGAALLAVTMLINPRSTEPPTAGTAPEATPDPSPSSPAGETPPAPPHPEPAADTSAAPAPAMAPELPQPSTPPAAPVRPAGESVPGAIAALAADVASPYRLVARTTEPTWIRVRTGDGRSSEETLAAGEMREWVSEQPFVLTVGNAGGISLELNGRMLPPLGARGTVIPRLVLPPR